MVVTLRRERIGKQRSVQGNGQRQDTGRPYGQCILSKGGKLTDQPALLQKPLLLLAWQQKFKKIEEILTALKAPALATWLTSFGPIKNSAGSQQACREGITMLHLIMEHRPPVKLVDLLIMRLGELKDGFVPEDAADWRGRTPLHLAVYFCCDSTVIKRLVHGAGAVVPAVTKDATGRLPLHWACESPRGRNNSNRGKGTCVFRCGNRSKQCDNMVEIIEVLMEAYPHAVTVKDLKRCRPQHRFAPRARAA